MGNVVAFLSRAQIAQAALAAEPVFIRKSARSWDEVMAEAAKRPCYHERGADGHWRRVALTVVRP